MRAFKLKGFARFCRDESISDSALAKAVARAEAGLIDADLGGGVIKQRVARRGQGKSGGFRTIILFRQAERAIFAYGFAKKDRDNIDRVDLVRFRELAKDFLAFGDAEVRAMIEAGNWIEVESEDGPDEELR
jgi:hypothetical protein